MKNNSAAMEDTTTTKDKEESSKKDQTTIRLTQEMNEEIDRLMCEEGCGNRSEFVRGLIGDGLNYRNKPQPFLPAGIQAKLLGLLIREAKVLCYEDGQIVASESSVEKLRSLLGKRMKGSLSLDLFILIAVAVFLIGLACALIVVFGN